MHLRSSYEIAFGRGASKLCLPARFTFAAGKFELLPHERGGLLHVFVPIERARLAIRGTDESVDGRKNPLTIEIPDLSIDALTAKDVLASLTFLTGVSMSITLRLPEDELVPDDEEDNALLASLGTNKVHVQTRLRLSVAPISLRDLDSSAFEKLLQRKAGLHLYAEAMQLERPVAKYRELWRVLESAFSQTDDDLVASLSCYQPAMTLRFSREELRSMLILRGRASHAQSSAGLAEIRNVNLAAEESIARLTVLAAAVILTKKSWGYPTTEVDPVGEVGSFVGPDKSLILVLPTTSRTEASGSVP